MKKLLLIVVVSAVLLVGLTVQSMSAPIKIGISQLLEHPALDAVREGVIDELEEAGYIMGEDVEFISRNAQGDYSNAISIAQSFDREGVDIVV